MTSQHQAYHQVDPYVAGGVGEGTRLRLTDVPPRADAVHYEFQGWNGDWLVTSHPVFLATREAADLLGERGLTGFVVRDVTVSTDQDFPELSPVPQLPEFVWLDVTAAAGQGDLGLTERADLVLSDRALALLRPGLAGAEVEDWTG